VVVGAQLNQSEVGNTLTPFGSSLGLVTSDINGNASHNIFTGTFGLNVVDFDSRGHILSLAGTGQVTGGGVVTPEPSSVAVFGLIGIGGLGMAAWRRRSRVKIAC